MVSRGPASPAAAPHLYKKRLMFTTANTSSPSASAVIPESKMTGTDFCVGDDLTINTKVIIPPLLFVYWRDECTGCKAKTGWGGGGRVLLLFFCYIFESIHIFRLAVD